MRRTASACPCLRWAFPDRNRWLGTDRRIYDPVTPDARRHHKRPTSHPQLPTPPVATSSPEAARQYDQYPVGGRDDRRKSANVGPFLNRFLTGDQAVGTLLSCKWERTRIRRAGASALPARRDRMPNTRRRGRLPQRRHHRHEPPGPPGPPSSRPPAPPSSRARTYQPARPRSRLTPSRPSR